MTSLSSEVSRALRKAERGSMAWSTAYHGSGMLSLLASASAAFIAATNLKGLSGTQTIWIAALSGSAATLTAISKFVGFSRKWRANRKTRTALRKLKSELKSGGETDALRERFYHVMDVHDDAIEGAEAG